MNEEYEVFKVFVIECPHCRRPIEVKIPNPPKPLPNQIQGELEWPSSSDDEDYLFKTKD